VSNIPSSTYSHFIFFCIPEEKEKRGEKETKKFAGFRLRFFSGGKREGGEGNGWPIHILVTKGEKGKGGKRKAKKSGRTNH